MKTYFTATLAALALSATSIASAAPNLAGIWNEDGVNQHGKTFHYSTVLNADGTVRSYWFEQKSGYNPGFWTYDPVRKTLRVQICPIALYEPAAPSAEDCRPRSSTGLEFNSAPIESDNPTRIEGVFLNTSSATPRTAMTYTR